MVFFPKEDLPVYAFNYESCKEMPGKIIKLDGDKMSALVKWDATMVTKAMFIILP